MQYPDPQEMLRSVSNIPKDIAVRQLQKIRAREAEGALRCRDCKKDKYRYKIKKRQVKKWKKREKDKIRKGYQSRFDKMTKFFQDGYDKAEYDRFKAD